MEKRVKAVKKKPAKIPGGKAVEVQMKTPVKEEKSAISKTTKKQKAPNSSDSITKQINGNLIALQKIHVNIAEKFNKLSTQLASLLALFETAAKKFAESPTIQDKELSKKMDQLLDLNKAIAKGLSLMGERMHEAPPEPKLAEEPKPEPVPSPTPAASPAPTPAPQTTEFKPPAGKPLPRL